MKEDMRENVTRYVDPMNAVQCLVKRLYAVLLAVLYGAN
jgi:hypothetical protein